MTLLKEDNQNGSPLFFVFISILNQQKRKKEIRPTISLFFKKLIVEKELQKMLNRGFD
jgi:hypothetical protein